MKRLAVALFLVLLVSGCRWYTGAGPFTNTVPTTPSVHPNSANAISHFHDYGPAVIAWKKWSSTLFTADENTPRYSVQITRFHFGSYNWLDNVPIPDNAVPDPGSSPTSTDGHMAISDGTCIWDFFEAKKVNGQWTAGWINRMPIASDGIYDQGASGRGSGFANIQGLMAPPEFNGTNEGTIDHALMFSYHSVKSGGPVFPATESDGASTASWAIPEGARLYLPRSFDLSSYPGWVRTFGKALQEYGAYLGDVGGPDNPSFYALNPLGNNQDQNPYPWGTDEYPEIPTAITSALKVENYGSQTASQHTPQQNICGSSYR